MVTDLTVTRHFLLFFVDQKVFPGLIKLRKICNHPDLAHFEHNISEGKDNDNITKSSDYGHWERSGKMLVVESLLRMWKEKKHRVLLFSQSKQVYS